MRQPLQQWMAGFASDAVRTQRIFSEAFLGNGSGNDLLYLREAEISMSFIAAIERAAAVELAAAPLNLNYAIRFRTRTERHHRLRLAIVQLPLPAPNPPA